MACLRLPPRSRGGIGALPLSSSAGGLGRRTGALATSATATAGPAEHLLSMDIKRGPRIRRRHNLPRLPAPLSAGLFR